MAKRWCASKVKIERGTNCYLPAVVRGKEGRHGDEKGRGISVEKTQMLMLLLLVLQKRSVEHPEPIHASFAITSTSPPV